MQHELLTSLISALHSYMDLVQHFVSHCTHSKECMSVGQLAIVIEVSLLQELRVLETLGYNRNIIQLYGSYIKGGNLMLLLEYMQVRYCSVLPCPGLTALLGNRLKATHLTIAISNRFHLAAWKLVACTSSSKSIYVLFLLSFSDILSLA